MPKFDTSLIGPPPTAPTQEPTAAADSTDLQTVARQMAVKHGIDPETFVRLVDTESKFNPNAVSPRGAIGLGQLMPDTAIELGVDPTDPVQNLEGSAKYLRQQLDRFGDYPKALAAYNAGPANVRKYGGVPPFPETQNYVDTIAGTDSAKVQASPTMQAAPAPARRPAGSGPKFDTSLLTSGAATAPETDGGGVGGAIEGFVKDTIDGAVGPFVAAAETGKAILSDPAVGVLPASEQPEHQQKAFDSAVKGAAFWGSMLVGGGIANLPLRTVMKMALSGAGAMATYEGVSKLPKVATQEMNFADYTKDVSTAATFGALTGGAFAALGPKAAQLAYKTTDATGRTIMKAAEAVVHATPGGRQLQQQVAGWMREFQSQLWDPALTSGRATLMRLGQAPLVGQLLESRAFGGTTAGKYVAGFFKNIQGLNEDERMMMGGMLDKINFKDFENDALGQRVLRMGSERTKEVLQRAWAESERLQMLGEAIQRAGMQTYHPDTEEFHKFLLRDRYLPHRFVNAEQFRVDGPVRQKAIAAVERMKNLTNEDATIWVDRFADRIENETTQFLNDPTKFRTGSSHYRIGRVIGLPGYETDVAKILPQYYDSASRRLILHAQFGPVETTSEALQKSLFHKGDLGERMLEDTPGQQELFSQPEMSGAMGQAQMEMFPEKVFRGRGEPPTDWGRGVPTTPVPPHQPATIDEIVADLRGQKMAKARRDFALVARYPRAFAQLAAIDDPHERQLAHEIVYRQLGGLQDPARGERILGKAAQMEVITKLALGAIAQPSQMLSAVVRTGWKGAFKNLMLTMKNDPEALDFAMRTGAILRSIVRESEQSLTGGETDFLKRVYFTQMDMKSRVFGALQGASFAEHNAERLATLVRKPGAVNRRMVEKIEERFVKLGIDPVAVVRQGGTLTDEQLLRAGQTVAMDVNFWGDSLSLPAYWRSPYGRFITQFKSFGHQQTQLIKEHVVKPALVWAESGGKKGDIGPLTRMALTMPLGGEIITDLKKFVRARKRTDVPTERVMENIANAAGFGLAWDAWEAGKYGMSGALGFYTGPIIGELGKAHAAARDPQKLVRFSIETGLPVSVALTPGLNALTPIASVAAPGLANIATGETGK